MIDKEYQMTKQEYLADQHENEESMNHYDEEGYWRMSSWNIPRVAPLRSGRKAA